MIEINMQMPEKCGLCPCFHFDNPMYCQAVRADKNKKIVNPYGSPRPEWCPLKEQEAVEPYMDYDGHDVWRCGNCGATIFHIEHSQTDEDWKNYAKFCRQCGKKVKWK